ncbi:MAG: MaoC family dehydratase [Deltaproteobacteria bacterium]|nr:MaoC family dehydratase [Deltaproteobacteria bacterium]
MADKLYFEDFPVGRSFDVGGATVSEAEILAFARQFDPQPFHIDAEAAKKSMFGGIIASGWHTASIAMRLQVDGILNKSHSMGSPGIDQLRWLKPVRPGDTLRCRIEVMEARPSQSKPDRGSVKCRYELSNQRGEVVMTMEGWGMFARRPA